MGAERKWLLTLFSAAFLSLIILLFSSISAFSFSKPFPSIVQVGSHYPPAFAYYIWGGRGDCDRIFRLLLAVYHPRNRYLLHLTVEVSEEERRRLSGLVKSVASIRAFGNVDVLGKPDRLTYMGSTNIATTLRAAAILLRLDSGWNWFITLTAMDYPLLTQDENEYEDVPKFLFEYCLKEYFLGSPWVTLSRSFLEFCILGWDNLPRTMLMYFTNVILSQEGYFHSVICNSPEFKNTTVNNDLRYMIWDSPPRMEPHFLNVSDFDQMVQSGAAFARQFAKDDPVLNLIDEKILKRGLNRPSPGAWCSGRRSWWMDPCSQWGDVNIMKPGPQAKKFEESITNLLDDWTSQSNQCK
ncbi:hypothetical protein F8388_014374 [Cannabis sativa]|uniref:Uncharacterized protein n=1 Tax=Cannabis sativa TaxID=3483 RepID=A0A7J6FYI6_CANSA|nr:hypothetical protein F8388_014374 [Cannabis sativa]